MVDWELIRQQKQMKINKDNIHKKNKRVDKNYKLGDKVMIDGYSALNMRYHIRALL